MKSHNIYLINNYNELSIKELRTSSILKNNMLLQYISESILDPEIELRSPIEKNSTRISDLIKDKKVLLFFRFKENDCDACIQKGLELLKKTKNQLHNQRIIILSGYKNVSQFYAYAKSENILLEIYNVDVLPIPIDNQNNPYFFILNERLEMKNIFIPMKEDMKLTADYLDCIKDKYWHIHNENCNHIH